jgi:hypothetical protein
MRQCWFCDAPIAGTTASREHVIGQWLQSLLGISAEEARPTLTSLPTGTELKHRRHPLSQLKTGSICAKCNNGWMSELERAVASTLVPLMHGERRLADIRRAERLILARWATKTAYALDAGGLEQRVPKDHFGALRANNKGLPPQVAVFAADHDPTRKWYFAVGGTWSHAAITPTGQARVEKESYKIVLQLDRLVLVVAYWPLRGWNFRIEKEQLVKIWPVTSQAAVYAHPSPMPSSNSEDLCLRHSLAISVSPTRKAEERA